MRAARAAVAGGLSGRLARAKQYACTSPTVTGGVSPGLCSGVVTAREDVRKGQKSGGERERGKRRVRRGSGC